MTKNKHKNIDSTGLTVLYYLLQYIIIRLFLFGFVLSPSIKTMFLGLNLDSVVGFVKYIFMYFRLALSSGYIITAILLVIPFVLYLIWCLRCVIIYLYALVMLIRSCSYYCQYLRKKSSIDLSKCVVIKCGSPGTGKSSSGLWQAVETARRLWIDLQDKYFILGQLVGRLKARSVEVPDKLLNDYKEVKSSYEFYSKNDCIPCLWTNIPVRVDGQFSNYISRNHMEQLNRLPAYSVLFFDEVGTVVSVDEGRDKPLAVSDFFRLCRHFGEFRIICTEQDRENVYIDIRRVVADNEQMLSQKWVLSPLLPLLAFKLIRFLFRLNRKRMRFLAPILRWFNKSLKYIGFRRFKAASTGNAEFSYNEDTKKYTYYLPTLLNCTYDDRTYREGYKVKNKVIKPDIFKSLVLPKDLCLTRDED